MTFLGLRCGMLSSCKHIVFELLFGSVFGVPVLRGFLFFGCHILDHSMRGHQHLLAQVLGSSWMSSCTLSALVCIKKISGPFRSGLGIALGVIMHLVCISLHLSASVCISLHLRHLVCINLHWSALTASCLH